MPLTIGIIGHREIALEEIKRVRSEVKTILTTYRRHAPKTPILFLSAMAAGADQIAAEVAMEIEGIKVIAILPMEQSEYERDFGPEEVLHFRSLLARCYRIIQSSAYFDLLDERDATDEKGSAEDLALSKRTLAYRDCGRLISQQSHLLIAVWDGVVSPLIGGTSDTITHRLSAIKQAPSKVALEHTWSHVGGVLLHVKARRKTSAEVTDGRKSDPKANEIHALGRGAEPQLWRANVHDPILENFRTINRLLDARLPSRQGESSLTAALMEIADAQAAKLQTGFRRLIATLLILGVLTLFQFDLQQGFTSRYPFLVAAATLVVTITCWLLFSKGTLRDRFYQFRALAEGLRVQSIWIKCNVDRDAADEYLQGIPDLPWIPRAMRTALFLDSIQTQATEEIAPITSEEIDVEARAWIDGQIAYFGGGNGRIGAIAECGRSGGFFDRLSIGGLCVALLCFGFNGLRLLPGGTPLSDGAIRTEQLTLYASLSISAAAAAYGQLMAYREVRRQYEISMRSFEQGREILQTNQVVGKERRQLVQSVVIQIGTQALQETGGWLALKRDRSVNLI